MANVTIAAILDFQNSISQRFEKINVSNSVFKLISPEPIKGANLNRFGLAGLTLVTISDFQMVLSKPFKKLMAEIWN